MIKDIIKDLTRPIVYSDDVALSEDTFTINSEQEVTKSTSNGYADGVISPPDAQLGSISPTSNQVHTDDSVQHSVVAFFDHTDQNSNELFIVRITGHTSDSGWVNLSFDGHIFARVNATYSLSGTTSIWTWTSPSTFPLIDGASEDSINVTWRY